MVAEVVAAMVEEEVPAMVAEVVAATVEEVAAAMEEEEALPMAAEVVDMKVEVAKTVVTLEALVLKETKTLQFS